RDSLLFKSAGRLSSAPLVSRASVEKLAPLPACPLRPRNCPCHSRAHASRKCRQAGATRAKFIPKNNLFFIPARAHPMRSASLGDEQLPSVPGVGNVIISGFHRELSVKIGHYDVLAELGRGGMGAVYRGVDSRLGRVVAIKRILLSQFDPDSDESN